MLLKIFTTSKNPESNTFSYDSIQMFDVENTNTFYVIELNPTGFILISADDLLDLFLLIALMKILDLIISQQILIIYLNYIKQSYLNKLKRDRTVNLFHLNGQNFLGLLTMNLKQEMSVLC